MATILIACVLHCCTEVKYLPPPPWGADDDRALGYARTGCAQEYKDRSCLIKFQRKSEGVYTAICGKENN